MKWPGSNQNFNNSPRDMDNERDRPAWMQTVADAQTRSHHSFAQGNYIVFDIIYAAALCVTRYNTHLNVILIGSCNETFVCSALKCV